MSDPFWHSGQWAQVRNRPVADAGERNVGFGTPGPSTAITDAEIHSFVGRGLTASNLLAFSDAPSRASVAWLQRLRTLGRPGSLARGRECSYRTRCDQLAKGAGPLSMSTLHQLLVK
jgi:hypothetical protein